MSATDPRLVDEMRTGIDPCGYAWCSTRGTVGYLEWRREKVRLCAVHMDPKMHPKDLHKGLVWDEPPASGARAE